MRRPLLSVLLAAVLVPALAAAAGSFSVSVRAHVLTTTEMPAAVRQSDAALHRALGLAPASKPEVAPAPTPAVTPVAPTTMPAERVPVQRVEPMLRTREPVREVVAPRAAPAAEAPRPTHLDAREMPAEPMHRPDSTMPGVAGPQPMGPRDGRAPREGMQPGTPREGMGPGRDGMGPRDGGPHEGPGGAGTPDRNRHDTGGTPTPRSHRDDAATGGAQDARSRHGGAGEGPAAAPGPRPRGGAM